MYVYHYRLEYVHEAFNLNILVHRINSVLSVIDILRPTPDSSPNRSVNHLTLTTNTDFMTVTCASEFDESLRSRFQSVITYWRST
jgi:hypothetical protein